MPAGVDEAGRGPVVGPMIIALVDVKDEDVLKEIGVKDSKELSPDEREELYAQILDVANFVKSERVEPFVIDEFVGNEGLTKLELKVMAELIKLAPSEEVIVDAPSVNTSTVEEFLRSATGKRVKAFHRADKIHPVVSAASIIAKVERDRIIRGIEEVYGKIGSGYPHDRDTLEFVERWMRRWGGIPSFVRRSWKTTMRIAKNLSQTTLDDFLR